MTTLIVKVTEQCNSNCAYCDVVRKHDAVGSMPVELLEVLFVRIDEHLRAHPENRLELVWHGGEPLLLGPEFFRTACELQRKHCPTTRYRIAHSVQTNLTLFREAFVEPFHALGIRALGSSFDPEPGMRGPGPAHDSAWYNRRFLDALSVAQQNGFAVGIIYVVTRRSLQDPVALFHYLMNLTLLGSVSFNPVLIYDEERQALAVTPGQYVEFLGKALQAWWPIRSRFPDVQPFRSLLDNVVNGSRHLGCAESGRCARSHVNITPDGETSQCGRSADWGLLPYGNLRERSIDEIIAHPGREALIDRIDKVRQTECAGCRFWEICHGGCPLDAWSKHKSFDHKSEWCAARKDFLQEHFEPLAGVKFQPEQP